MTAGRESREIGLVLIRLHALVVQREEILGREKKKEGRKR